METLIAEGIGKSYKGRQVVPRGRSQDFSGRSRRPAGPQWRRQNTSFYIIVGLVQPETAVFWSIRPTFTRVPMYLRARNFGISYLPQEAVRLSQAHRGREYSGRGLKRSRWAAASAAPARNG